MKTKSFLVFSASIFATTLFLIVFHSQQPDSLQTIVTQTHQQIKNFQENFKEVEENHLLEDKYLSILGFNNRSPVEVWHNTSVPAVVSYVLDGQHAQAVGFVKNILTRLPTFTVILYNLGLSKQSLDVVSTYCNSSKCMILDFDLDQFPSHVKDESLHAFRPLIIQHALVRVGGVLFLECDIRYTGSPEQIADLYSTAVRGGGVVAWQMRPAVSSVTHPRMFSYFHTVADNFLFLPTVDVVKLLVVHTPDVLNHVMKPWVECALTHDCILPIGAQSGGCRFDKKPQYRYSGCHSYDVSALNIALGLWHNLDEKYYTYKETESIFSIITNEEARHEYNLLEKNATTGPSDVTDVATFKNEQSAELP